MDEILHKIKDKNSINGKLFRCKDKIGVIIRYISAKDISEYDEIEYYLNGSVNFVPAIWIKQFIDEIYFDLD
jgi:hypothetical protein